MKACIGLHCRVTAGWPAHPPADLAAASTPRPSSTSAATSPCPAMVSLSSVIDCALYEQSVAVIMGITLDVYCASSVGTHLSRSLEFLMYSSCMLRRAVACALALVHVRHHRGPVPHARPTCRLHRVRFPTAAASALALCMIPINKCSEPDDPV